MSTTYRIEHTTGNQSPALRRVYGSKESAAGALATVMGWTCGAVLSEGYTVDSGEAWSCYPSRAAMDRGAANLSGDVPRIVEATADDAEVARALDLDAARGEVAA